MFDFLGSPWPVHDCIPALGRRIKRSMERRHVPSDSPFAVLSGLTFGSCGDEGGDDFFVSEGFFEESVLPFSGQRDEEFYETKRMDPMGDEVESMVCVVREINRETKLTRRLSGLGLIGKQLLGIDAVVSFMQITVVRNDAHPFESYTCIVDRAFMRGIRENMIVWITIRARESGTEKCWVVESLESIPV